MNYIIIYVTYLLFEEQRREEMEYFQGECPAYEVMKYDFPDKELAC